MNRIALALLISLAVVAAVYTSVLSASSHGTSRGSVHLTAGLLPDLSHQRSPAISLNEFYSDLKGPVQYHDCSDGNSALDPND